MGRKDSLKPLRQGIRSELVQRVAERCDPVPKAAGRMTEEIAQHALRWIAEGGSVTSFAMRCGLRRQTIAAYLKANHPDELAAAKAEGYDALADDLLSIASTPVEMVETIETTDARGGVTTTVKRGDSVLARQLTVKTALSMLERLAPEKYGSRTTVDVNVSMAQQIAAARSRVREMGVAEVVRPAKPLPQPEVEDLF